MNKCPRQSAEQSLTAARNEGDRRREALALADLGLMHLYEGDAPQAVALLEDALVLAGQLGDPSWEGDILGNLGMATAAAGQFQRGLALLEQALSSARAVGDRLAEKTALAHLGLTWSRLREPIRALTFLAPALALARVVGDWQHEAELLWYLAIQHAVLGQREQAIAHAETAVALFDRMAKPQAAWFARHLQAYLASEAGNELSETSGDGPLPPLQPLAGGVFVPGAWEAQLDSPPAAPEKVVSGPRLLDMALSATTAMVKFLGSGLKTTPPEACAKRLQTCAACEHHTGLRCRLCGCFTGAKAAMAHEDCPLGKWPA